MHKRRVSNFSQSAPCFCCLHLQRYTREAPDQKRKRRLYNSSFRSPNSFWCTSFKINDFVIRVRMFKVLCNKSGTNFVIPWKLCLQLLFNNWKFLNRPDLSRVLFHPLITNECQFTNHVSSITSVNWHSLSVQFTVFTSYQWMSYLATNI